MEIIRRAEKRMQLELIKSSRAEKVVSNRRGETRFSIARDDQQQHKPEFERVLNATNAIRRFSLSWQKTDVNWADFTFCATMRIRTLAFVLRTRILSPLDPLDLPRESHLPTVPHEDMCGEKWILRIARIESKALIVFSNIQGVDQAELI
jgi:hypothetical protein